MAGWPPDEAALPFTLATALAAQIPSPTVRAAVAAIMGFAVGLYVGAVLWRK